MAQHTLTLTPRQELAAARAVELINAQRAAEDPPKNPFTVDDYLQSKLRQSLQADIDAYENWDRIRITEAYAAATNAVQANVRNDLGIT